MVSVAELVEGHVSLEIESLDRIYLNGYVPTLQVGGQVATFMTQHLGFPFPSPAIFRKIGDRFRADVKRFAAEQEVPLIRFEKRERKLDRVQPLLRKAERTGRTGVVAIGVAQESRRSYRPTSGTRRAGSALIGSTSSSPIGG